MTSSGHLGPPRLTPNVEAALYPKPLPNPPARFGYEAVPEPLGHRRSLTRPVSGDGSTASSRERPAIPRMPTRPHRPQDGQAALERFGIVPNTSARVVRPAGISSARHENQGVVRLVSGSSDVSLPTSGPQLAFSLGPLVAHCALIRWNNAAVGPEAAKPMSRPALFDLLFACVRMHPVLKVSI